MIETYCQNGITISVKHNSELYNYLKTITSKMENFSFTSSKLSVSMQSSNTRKNKPDLSQVKVRITTNSHTALTDLVKAVRDYHCDKNYIYKELVKTFPNSKCPPLAVTSMSVDDYYTTAHIAAKDITSMFNIENTINSGLAIMLQNLNSETERKK